VQSTTAGQTLQNSIGFAITVVPIQLLPLLAEGIGWQWSFAILAIGPLVGAYFMHRLRQCSLD